MLQCQKEEKLNDMPYIVPQAVMRQAAKDKYREPHWGAEAIIDNLKHQIISVKIPGIKSVVSKCKISLQNNPQPYKRPPLGTTKRGNSPGVHRQIDFSELP